MIIYRTTNYFESCFIIQKNIHCFDGNPKFMINNRNDGSASKYLRYWYKNVKEDVERNYRVIKFFQND